MMSVKSSLSSLLRIWKICHLNLADVDGWILAKFFFFACLWTETENPSCFLCPHAKLLLINTNLCSFFNFSCRISSWLHTSTSCPHTSPWNVTTPTPRNDATTSRSSASPWSPTISSSTSWSDATTRRDTTTSRSTTPWRPTRKDARSPWGRKSTTTNCWKILMKQVTLKRNYLIFP